MGRKKLDQIDLIPDKNQRNVAYCKRKRGLVKKAMELSKLCDQRIFLVIFDQEKQKLVQYNSTLEFTANVGASLTSSQNSHNFKHERYTNKDYEQFESNQYSKVENSVIDDDFQSDHRNFQIQMDMLIKQETDDEKQINDTDKYQIQKTKTKSKLSNQVDEFKSKVPKFDCTTLQLSAVQSKLIPPSEDFNSPRSFSSQMLKQSAQILERQKLEVLNRRLQKQICKQFTASNVEQPKEAEIEYQEPQNKLVNQDDFENHAESVYVLTGKPCIENLLNAQAGEQQMPIADSINTMNIQQQSQLMFRPKAQDKQYEAMTMQWIQWNTTNLLGCQSVHTTQVETNVLEQLQMAEQPIEYQEDYFDERVGSNLCELSSERKVDLSLLKLLNENKQYTSQSDNKSNDKLNDELLPQDLVSYTHSNPNNENQDDVPDFEKNTMD